MARFDCLAGLIAIALVASCAQILGTDFEVEPLGGSGQGDQAETLWEGDYPWDIAVDATYVYWSGAGGPDTTGGIRRQGKKAGSLTESYEPAYGFANRILLDGTHLYFTAGDGSQAAPFVVGRCEHDTLTCETLHTNDTQMIGLAIYQDDLYVASFSTTVLRMPKAGGAVPTSVLTTVPDGVSQLLVVGSQLWGTSFNSGRVWRADLPITPTDPDAAMDMLPGVNALAPFSDSVVVGQAVAGGGLHAFGSFPSSTQIVDNQNQVADMVTEGAWVYWATFGSGQILRMPDGGGTVALVRDGEPDANGVAVDESHVYFTRYATKAIGGAVRRIPLP